MRKIKIVLTQWDEGFHKNKLEYFKKNMKILILKNMSLYRFIIQIFLRVISLEEYQKIF